MKCDLCLEQRTTEQITTKAHGTVHVCALCVIALVCAYLDRRDEFCDGCTQRNPDGTCAQLLTPRTCA